MTIIVYKSTFLLQSSGLLSPDQEPWCGCSKQKKAWLEWLCILASLQELSRFVSHVYLSASDFVSGWVDLAGGETGLVSAPSPFCRQFLNSANLHRMQSSFVFVYPNEYLVIRTGTSGLYHGFSSSAGDWGSFCCCIQLLSPFSLALTFSSLVSVWESLWRCSQLLSPLSLARTLVVRNTAAFSPSETHPHTLGRHEAPEVYTLTGGLASSPKWMTESTQCDDRGWELISII